MNVSELMKKYDLAGTSDAFLAAVNEYATTRNRPMSLTERQRRRALDLEWERVHLLEMMK